EPSYHEWLVKFEKMPDNLEMFAQLLDDTLRAKNVYYDDLISGNILARLHITPLRRGAFIDYMKSIGKLGGQNKVPRLSNDRVIAEGLTPYR
ncbi:MAG TPA: GH3 auxin-responsive promoter family protein, partial [Phnomibacter sp.]|nr:GH3 auxin-responsive promoter family protein [Phnomibacter sp.]